MDTNNEELLYIPCSILDTDLYKFTMQQAVRQHFPNIQALYRFTHRDLDVLFPRKCIQLFHESIQRVSYLVLFVSEQSPKSRQSDFRDVYLTTEEKNWLADTCPFFSKDYIDYLSEYRFDPAQISIKFVPVSDDGEEGRVEIEASGLWSETILWEVPLMSGLSELYFRVGATNWSYEGQKDIASEKARTLLRAGCIFSEFGTRRRRSFYIHDLVVATLKEVADAKNPQEKGSFFGTSNPYFAKKYGIRPIGTIAHEWFMGVAALGGYDGANMRALRFWEETYPNDLNVTLTDTFSTSVFFQEFANDPARAAKWAGLRQDSGDPFEFAPAAKRMYESVGIDIHTKNIIYSDSLTVDKVLRLKKQCDDIGFKCSFGIGTSLTNDFKTTSSGYTEKSRALNMVIKLSRVDDKECVKISDDLTKNTGDKLSVDFVKKLYGLAS